MFPSNGIKKTQQQKKTTDLGPRVPNLGHAFQAIVQLPELSMVDILLMEVCKLTPRKLKTARPRKVTKKQERGVLFFSFFPRFFRGR